MICANLIFEIQWFMNYFKGHNVANIFPVVNITNSCVFMLGLKMSSNGPKERTLLHNGLLPSLPLPDLEQTCREYLLSGSVF